ncbi:hypothetical protein SDJN02_09704, partial [Cucurbita argyrosperma subsp. argyrosperma]
MKASSASFAVVAASLAFLNINPSPNSRKRNFQSQQRLRREGGETEEDRKARREKEPVNRSKGSSLRSDSRENLREILRYCRSRDGVVKSGVRYLEATFRPKKQKICSDCSDYPIKEWKSSIPSGGRSLSKDETKEEVLSMEVQKQEMEIEIKMKMGAIIKTRLKGTIHCCFCDL